MESRGIGYLERKLMATIENRKPSQKQRKAAEIRLQNPELDSKAVMALSGYGTGAQHTPSVVEESKGYKKALAEFGLTEELITTALVEDIKGKPKKRVHELRLGSDILGMTEHEPDRGNKPAPILAFIFNGVRNNNSDKEGGGNEETPEDSSRGNISQQDSINHPLLDTLSPERQDPDANEHSK